MAKQGDIRCLLLLFLSLWTSGSAETIDMYFQVGLKIRLAPDPAIEGPITRIVWKHGVDLSAEAINQKITYFGEEKDKKRMLLDLTDGSLTISDASLADSHVYQVEVNSNIQEKKYNVQVITRVPKPSVDLQPLACGPRSDKCSLECSGTIEKNTGPVTFSWMRGDGTWVPGQQTLPIVKNKETLEFPTFSCNMSNPVSSEQSRSISNPFWEKKPEPLGSGAVAGIVIGIIGVVGGVVGGLAYWQRSKIISFLNRDERGSGAPSERSALSGSNNAESNVDKNVDKNAENDKGAANNVS